MIPMTLCVLYPRLDLPARVKTSTAREQAESDAVVDSCELALSKAMLAAQCEADSEAYDAGCRLCLGGHQCPLVVTAHGS
jgi:hypothetical protein